MAARGFDTIPDRLLPDLLMRSLNEPIVLRDQGLSLRVPESEAPIELAGALQLRWHPSTAIEFEGKATLPQFDLPEGSLLFSEPNVEADAFVTHISAGNPLSSIRCVLKSHVELAWAPKDPDRLTFYLVNFPDYLGLPVRPNNEEKNGASLGRIELVADELLCRVDEIREHEELRKQAKRGAGYVLSHFCELVPATPLQQRDLPDLFGRLQLLFGFLRGAWCGPVIPRGFNGGSLVWEQIASWRIDDPREVPTWLPQRSPLDLSELFKGFVRLSGSSQWTGPLRTALFWYVAANSSATPLEARIILAQVALELLAFVEVVEVQSLESFTRFNQQGAGDRIRALLLHLGIPIEVPTHMTELSQLASSEAHDGPGVISYLRNRLVHATEDNRKDLTTVKGMHLWQASQLAIGYVELAVLALVGYRGRFARRAWQGWKGEDETLVPWV